MAMATAFSPAPRPAAVSLSGRSAARSSARPRSGAVGEQAFDGGAEDLVGDRTHVLTADASLAVDEEGLGDPVHAVIDRDLPRQIPRVRERQAELPQESLRGLDRVLDVHAHDDDVAVTPRAPSALEHRRLLVTGGSAPRGPEVQHDDLA